MVVHANLLLPALAAAGTGEAVQHIWNAAECHLHEPPASAGVLLSIGRGVLHCIVFMGLCNDGAWSDASR